MLLIRLGLELGFNIGLYAKPEFNTSQMQEIFFGLRQNLNASLYAKQEFSGKQMDQISICLDQCI